MSMHMIRARASTSSKKVKSKSKRLQQAQQEHNDWLRSMGIKVDKDSISKRHSSYKKVSRAYVHDLSVDSNTKTSDAIPGNGNKKDTIKYPGNEIMGVVLNHKSNYEPVRRDNKPAAVNASQMRRS